MALCWQGRQGSVGQNVPGVIIMNDKNDVFLLTDI